MRILFVGKYPPIQGGVAADAYWTIQLIRELGHEVVVVTNAGEVESQYRVHFRPSDKRFISGWPLPVAAHSTYVDVRHFIVPDCDLFVSKLTSLCLTIASQTSPDLIWAHYVDPYGVAALLTSLLTDIPYVVKHAGSDLGRLFCTPQLKPLYKEVFVRATAILTRPAHHAALQAVGVADSRLFDAVQWRLPPSLFFPARQTITDRTRLGIYGKAGPSKGTSQLLCAVQSMGKTAGDFAISALWGGRHIDNAKRMIHEKNLGSVITTEPFAPPWRIPQWIRRQNVILFLENRFGIPFHAPIIPLEALSCGRPIITTEEIANKPMYRGLLQEGVNAFVIKAKMTPTSITNAFYRAREWLLQNEHAWNFWIDTRLGHDVARQAMDKLLSKLTEHTGFRT